MVNLANFRSIGRKIVCVGRNYREHAAELNNPVPTKPVLFMKATSAYLSQGEGAIIIPPGCQNLHQEVELGVIISKTAKNVSQTDAMAYVGGYTVALDMTARDFQDDAKKAGLPWFLAKSFDSSCPIGDFIPSEIIKDPHNVEIFCKINGKDQQRSKTDTMIFTIPVLIEYITKFCTLNEGDLLLTGTPAGVTQVKSGDVIEMGLEGITSAKFTVQ